MPRASLADDDGWPTRPRGAVRAFSGSDSRLGCESEILVAADLRAADPDVVDPDVGQDRRRVVLQDADGYQVELRRLAAGVIAHLLGQLLVVDPDAARGGGGVAPLQQFQADPLLGDDLRRRS